MYLYSVINNEEVGVKVSKKNQPKEFENIRYYIEKLLSKSNNYKPKEKIEEVEKKLTEELTKGKGFCILCLKEISFNKFKPLCYDCYNEFKSFFPIHGKYCHKCGEKDYNTDQHYPLCYNCYRKLYY